MKSNINIISRLPEKTTKKLSKGDISLIENAVNEIIINKINEIEEDNKHKINGLVESIEQKFDEQVNGVILENISDKLGDKINTKMYGVLRDIVGLLENAGIAVTEKTREYAEMLNEANKKVTEALKEREVIKEKHAHAQKDAFILRKCKGMRAEVIDAALEHFKNEPPEYVDDEAIDRFLSGDFSGLVGDYGDGYDSDDSTIDPDNIDDVLNEIREDARNVKPRIESLGDGLNKLTIMGGSSMNPDVLMEDSSPRARQVDTNPLLDDLDEDTAEAMRAIDRLSMRSNDFGF